LPKRFTDTDKWMDGWFYGLSPIDKLIWLYALDACNHTGVWKINIPMMSGMVGTKITVDQIEKALTDRIIKIDDDKYFIPKFLQFQYPKGLKKTVNAQRAVVESLIALGLRLTLAQVLPISYLSLCEGLPKSCLTLIDTDTDTDIKTNTNTDTKPHESTAPNQDLFDGKESKVEPTEEQIFRMEFIEPWCRSIREFGGIVHKGNFRHWMRLVDEYPMKDLQQACLKVKADDRWADKVEAKLGPKFGDSANVQRRDDGSLIA